MEVPALIDGRVGRKVTQTPHGGNGACLEQ